MAQQVGGGGVVRPTESELRSIFANMPDVYYRTDAEGRCVIASPSALGLLGYAPEELIGRPVADLYDNPDERRQLLTDMERSGGRVNDYEIALRHKDGHCVWISLNCQFHYDELGRVQGVEGYCRDVSEKRATAERLRHSEQQFRAIFNHLPDVYYRTDRDGNFEMLSPSVKSLLGYTPEELVGRPLCDIYLEPSARNGFLEKLRARGGLFYGFENRLRRKDGAEIWAMASSQLCYGSDGEIVGVEGIVKDISRQKSVEEKLRRYSRKLQDTVNDLEVICYSVAHDLCGPLRAIDGYTQILREDFGASLGAEGEEAIARINKGVVRMANLVDDLLAFSHVGRTARSITSFGMHPLVMEVIAEMDCRTIEFRVGALPTVTGDRALIRAVVSNLVENAVKFTRGRARPSVEIDCMADNSGETVFQIRDNGIGFDPQYANRLFRLFEQHHDYVEEYPGTGVGLAVVERIVRRHGGRVWAEGEKGKGAAFYFSLPSPVQAGDGASVSIVPAGRHRRG